LKVLFDNNAFAYLAQQLKYVNIFNKLKKLVKNERLEVVGSVTLLQELSGLADSNFFRMLSIPKGENRQIAAEILADKLKNKKNITLENLYKRETFENAWQILGDEKVQKIFYKSTTSRDRFVSVYQDANPDNFFNAFWKPVAELFRKDRSGAISVDGLIHQTFDLTNPRRPVVLIDLSREQASGLFWNETIQALIIKRLLKGLTNTAEYSYRENKSLNTLVILDEAHRLAPRGKLENGKKEVVRMTLIDAVRTTRKYGLGWMFISQTLSSLHKEIVEQLRIMFFGFGLALGTEFQSLRDLVGGDANALKLYQSFKDPHSSFNIESREYAFMTIEPISPLSFAGTPLFFTAFNTPEDFLKANSLKVD